MTPELEDPPTNPSNFTSKIFPSQTTPSFHATVRNHLLEEMRGLDPTAILVMKSLVKRGLYEKNDPDAVNLRESYGAWNLHLWKSLF